MKLTKLCDSMCYNNYESKIRIHIDLKKVILSISQHLQKTLTNNLYYKTICLRKIFYYYNNICLTKFYFKGEIYYNFAHYRNKVYFDLCITSCRWGSGLVIMKGVERRFLKPLAVALCSIASWP